MKKMYGFHGDVNFEKVDAIPEGAKKIVVKEGFIVEKGYGANPHVLKRLNDKKTMTFSDDEIEVFEGNNTLYFDVKKDNVVGIDHEEHGQKPLKPGIIMKSIEREYDANSDSERKVRD